MVEFTDNPYKAGTCVYYTKNDPVELTDNPYKAGMCVHYTKNYWRGLLRLEFETRGGVSGWIGKSGSDEGGKGPDQEGQQKHLSKEKLDWREKDNTREQGELR